MNQYYEISRIKDLMFGNPNNYKFIIMGNINKYPGIRISINENKSEMGYVNILNLYDSFDVDPDLIKLLNDDKVNFKNNNTLFLFNLNVYDDYRGKGLSKKIMEKCHDLSKDMDINYITLITDSVNQVAKNLYKKYNYEMINTDGKVELYCKLL